MYRVNKDEIRTCQSILGVKICIGDEVFINTGKSNFMGTVRYLTGTGVVLITDHKMVVVKVSKINSIMIKNIDGGGTETRVENAEETMEESDNVDSEGKESS
jgi:hypothetical protein